MTWVKNRGQEILPITAVFRQAETKARENAQPNFAQVIRSFAKPFFLLLFRASFIKAKENFIQIFSDAVSSQ